MQSLTEPLPPIFTMELKRRTPRIKFLPKSMPELSKICWCNGDWEYELPPFLEEHLYINDYDSEASEGKAIEND